MSQLTYVNRCAARRPDVLRMVLTGCLLLSLLMPVYRVLLGLTSVTAVIWHS